MPRSSPSVCRTSAGGRLTVERLHRLGGRRRRGSGEGRSPRCSCRRSTSSPSAGSRSSWRRSSGSRPSRITRSSPGSTAGRPRSPGGRPSPGPAISRRSGPRRRSAASGSAGSSRRWSVSDAIGAGSGWIYLGVFEDNDVARRAVHEPRVRAGRRRLAGSPAPVVTARDAGRRTTDAGRPAQPHGLVAGLVREATIVATVELERVLARSRLDRGRGPGRHRRRRAGPAPRRRRASSSRTRPRAGSPSPSRRPRAAWPRPWLATARGPCGRYLGFPDPASPDALDAFRRRAAADGVAISPGRGRPVRAVGPRCSTGSVTGPHLIVAERRPVPSPP